MSWHYLQGREAVSWAGACSDGVPFALSSLLPTRGGSCSPDNETDNLTDSQFGTTSEPLTASLGADTLTLSQVGSRAKILARPEVVKALTAASRVYGNTWRVSFATWDRGLSLWKTPQCSLLGGSELFLETWPRWGMMRAGACSAHDTLAPLINGTGSGLRLATPTAKANQLSPSMRKHPGCRAWAKPYPTPVAADIAHRRDKYKQGGTALSTVVGGQLNPPWVEWLMGWPIGWTDCEPLATDKYRRWLRLHGAS